MLRLPVRRCWRRPHHLRPSSSMAGSSPTRPRVVFSGIQPTGTPHLGNFLGAILSWVQLQSTASASDQLFFSIVGWHALTLPQQPERLRQHRREMLAVLLASGLNPARSVIFHQDHNQDHVELSWLLSCLTPVGKLRRMTSWKAKLADSRNANSTDEIDDSLLNTGLFTYPVLQAADILAYKATHIPVGEDQTQHLELARSLASSLNRAISVKTKSAASAPFKLPLPHPILTTTPRILSLLNPLQKMSKSNPNTNSRILLTDPPELIAKKIKGAVTDSTLPIAYNPDERPGVANLLGILARCEEFLRDSTSTQDSQQQQPVIPGEIAQRYLSKTHSALKSDVTDAVIQLFQKPRESFEQLMRDDAYLDHVAQDGARRAREHTGTVLLEIRRRLGLI